MKRQPKPRKHHPRISSNLSARAYTSTYGILRGDPGEAPSPSKLSWNTSLSRAKVTASLKNKSHWAWSRLGRKYRSHLCTGWTSSNTMTLVCEHFCSASANHLGDAMAREAGEMTDPISWYVVVGRSFMVDTLAKSDSWNAGGYSNLPCHCDDKQNY